MNGWSAGYGSDEILPEEVLRVSAARTGRPPRMAAIGVCGKKITVRNELELAICCDHFVR